MGRETASVVRGSDVEERSPARCERPAGGRCCAAHSPGWGSLTVADIEGDERLELLFPAIHGRLSALDDHGELPHTGSTGGP
jgi:hypothetical protein